MNDDEILEEKLRGLSAPELPGEWRAEILGKARRVVSKPVQGWPPFLVGLGRLWAGNPVTFGALATLWVLIFFLKASTPVDPAERMMVVRVDPGRPVYLVSMEEEVRLAEVWEVESESGLGERP